MKKIISLMLSLVIILSLVCVAAPSVSAASNMNTSSKGIEMIKDFEGLIKYPVEDNGQWSVGYGTGVTGSDLEFYKKNGITDKQATELLKQYLDSFEEDVNKFIDNNNLKLNQQQFDALVSFTYNLGPSWMSTSGGVLREAVTSGAEGDAFIFAIAQYCKASNKVNAGLMKRRLCEANLYLNGVYSASVPANFKYVTYNANLDGAVITVASTGKAVSAQGYDTTETVKVKATASKSGYVFLGWYTEANGGSIVTSLGLKTAKVETLYGHWQPTGGVLNADGSIKGVAASYTGYVPVNASHDIYDAPGGTKTKTVTGEDKLTIVAEHVDSNGVKWGKLSSGGWIDVTAGLEANVVYEDVASLIDPITVTVTSNNVNNRVGPGTKYAKQGKFSKGQKLTLTAVQKGGNYKWGKSEQGWIALHYTDYDTAVTGEVVDENATKVTALGTIIKTDVLNVRSGPGTHNPKVGTYKRGEQVKITLQEKVGGTTWGMTEKGWISLYYAQVTPVEPGSVPDIDLSGSNNGTTSGGSTGSAVTMTGVIIDCNTLRIRSDAGTRYAHIGNYTRGTRVTIYQTTTVNGDTWGQTDKGWICMRYVKLDSVITGAGVTGTIVNTTTVNVRANPGTNSAKVGSLAKGTKIEILDYVKVGNATWGQTEKGWVHLYYVKLDAPLSTLDAVVVAPETGVGGTGTGSAPEDTGTEAPETGATEETKYTVTVGAAEKGKVTASAASAAANAEVTLTITPDAGYGLDKLTVKDASGNVITVTNNKFTMPASNVTVTATFKVQYNVKINTAEGGKVTANTTACAPKTEVILTVAPSEGYELDNLSVMNTATNAAVEVSGGKFIMPESDVNVVATFKKTTEKTYNVALNAASNGKLSASTTTAKANDTVTLTVAPAADYVLDTITIKDAANNAISCAAVSGQENTYTFEMPAANVTVAATFKAATYTVTINNTTAEKGTVSVNPAVYEKGATVTLIVTPAYAQNEIKTLTVKAGDKVIETVKDGNNYKFTMPGADVTVESSFGKIRYALNIAKTVGGTVTADKETYAMNEVVTISIAPEDGYLRGEMIIKAGGKEIEFERDVYKYTFKMPGEPVSVEHVFKKNAYELDFTVYGKGGTVKADKETYGYKDTVTLTVVPEDGYELNVLTVKNGSTKLELKKIADNKYTFEMPIPDGEVVVSSSYKALPAKYEVTYSGGAVNLRETASNSAKVLASIPKGTILQSLEGSTDTWIKVTYKTADGKEVVGWIGSGLLTEVTK